MDPKNSDDHLHRFYFQDGSVRGVIVHLANTWQQIARRDQYPERVRRYLGEITAATALFGGDIKLKGSVSVQLKTRSALRMVYAELSAEGTLRGIARFDESAELPRQPQQWQDSNGVLAITIEREQPEHRWQGLVPLEGGNLAESFESYFERSEQLPTRIYLAVSNQACAGMLLQEVPSEGGVARERDAALFEHACHLADTITEQELLTLDAETILRRLFVEDDIKLSDAQPIRFACRCSRERVSAMLRSLGAEEVYATLEAQGQVLVTCEFCNEHYAFDAIDVSGLFRSNVPDATDARN